jgi:hypothetical protein
MNHLLQRPENKNSWRYLQVKVHHRNQPHRWHIGGKLLLVSTTPVANLPPVSTTPAVNFATGTTIVVDTVANLPPVSKTLVSTTLVTMTQVATTPVATTWVATTPGGKFATGIDDTSSK